SQARSNAPQIDWSAYRAQQPKFIGVRHFHNLDLAALVPYIDWQPFFQTWDLHGPYPAILQDPVVGEAAAKLFDDAQKMLRRMLAGRWIKAHAAVGFWPAQSEGDDIRLYRDEARKELLMTWHNLRQQTAKKEGVANKSLADFVAPVHSAVDDYLGMFAVTTGDGADERAARMQQAQDDYGAIMLKALADRFAEALAEAMHERVRKDLWGYAAQESLDANALLEERFQGIRPAPGYPACPDHAVKAEMFEHLQAERIGMHLTESWAMWPAASVSGFYLAHPMARYFTLGVIGEDQLADFARRSGRPLESVQRVLASLRRAA
ncbi:MAG: methionine synthase, partial [Betaproteobacteria bacterium]|nr:methionine synthase [Betaproteobacteria bacterium]